MAVLNMLNMKKSGYLFVGVLFIFVQNSYSSRPDEWGGTKGRVLLENWSVNLNVGFTSYFGDLSQYDLYVINKLMVESKPAFGIKLTKHIKNFGISGQVIYGGFKSNYRPEQSFETRLVEYSLQAGLEVLCLIMSGRSLDYGLNIFVGAGQFIFRTTQFVSNDGLQYSENGGTGIPEFVYFFGSGLYYNVSDRIGITADLSIRQAQNDNIDKYLANGDFDYYSLLSFGVTFSIGKIYSPVRYEPNSNINKGVPVWRAEKR